MIAGIVLEALRTVGMDVRAELLAERKWRRDNPCKVAAYYRVLARTRPRWSWLGLGRPVARWQARKWSAWCDAEQHVECARLSDAATALVLARLDGRGTGVPKRLKNGTGPHKHV